MFKDKAQDTVKPDIFITGVMKGGTTILHEYICTHPNIVAGSQKEIHYFSLFHDRGPEWYARHFKQVPKGCRTIDASPTYFDVTNTSLMPRLIRASAPDPRVIVITRDPILRALSHFVHFKKVNKAPALQDVSADEFFSSSFDDAFRQTGRFGFLLHQVLNFSLYARKYATYEQVLEPQQLLMLDNHALRENASEVMASVFEFLNEAYEDSSLFGVEKYSNKSSLDELEPATFRKLAEFLYADYRQFCSMLKRPYQPLEHTEERRNVA